MISLQQDLYSSNFGREQFVSVGWGKKETQFHGSAGKEAAKDKQKKLKANEFDSGRIVMTWRDDGQLFAVSFLHPKTKIRQFKTFDREGCLLHTSEQTSELGDCLVWKPSTNLVTTTTYSDDYVFFAYYERNGLKYKKTVLPMTPGERKVRSHVNAAMCNFRDVLYNYKFS